jgi:chaperone BCS1
MLEQLLTHYKTFMEISKSNPMVAGAIGLWGAGLVTWMLRNIPGKVWGFISTQLTTTVVFNNASSANSWSGNEIHFQAFMEWFRKGNYGEWSRHLSLDARADDEKRILVGMGYGTHFFFFKRRLFWVDKSRLESTGVSIEKQQFRITVFSRNHQLIRDLVEEFRYKHKDAEIGVLYWESKEWSCPVYIQKRPLETVIINRKVKNKLLKDIDYFIANREWFLKRGMPYKMAYVIYGPPGTGKTSLVKAMASHYNRNVYSLNLSAMSDDSLVQALCSVKPQSLVLIEDFDTNNTVKARHYRAHSGNSSNADAVVMDDVSEKSPHESENQTLATVMAGFERLTLSGLLNTLDGIVSLNDIIIFMTTNHLEDIDPALIRKGRVDYIVELPCLTDVEIREYIKLMFPDICIERNIVYTDIPGCDLQALFLEYKEDGEGFIKAIPGITPVSLLLAA